MTTVAFRKYKNHIEFAADTHVSNGFHSKWKKLYRFKDGIGAGAGSLPDMVTIRNTIIKYGFDPNLKFRLKGPDFLFWSFKYRKLYIYGRADPIVEMPDVEYHAIGSGCEFATGAMATGATPKRAVLIACKYNEHTSAPVTAMSAKF